MEVLLSAGGLVVARGRRVLLRGFSLTVAAHEVVHVAGPNGCGKSSLLRVLAGAVEPRLGAVRSRAVRVYLPERVALPESVSSTRWLAICDAPRVGRLAASNQRTGALSKGQLQRLVLDSVLSTGLEGPAAVYVLDEPWSGLDLGARSALDDQLTTLVERGSAVIFTDHDRVTTLTPSATINLGAGEDDTGAPARVVIEIARGEERTRVMVANGELAARLTEGWQIDGGELVS